MRLIEGNSCSRSRISLRESAAYHDQQCHSDKTRRIEDLIDEVINEDTMFQSAPLDLRNQRTYAVKARVNGLLDVARQSYKEANNDVVRLVTDLGTVHDLSLDLKYEAARGYYLRANTVQFEERNLPEDFINAVRKKKWIECQTMDIVKCNQRIRDSHLEVVRMSDKTIRQLIDDIREDISPLFIISNAIAQLDMVGSFAQLVTTQDYCKPDLTSALGVQNARHPIMEKIRDHSFNPNDVFATKQRRFQIITGCNMSGKSTFIRTIALLGVMAQTGSFVPATHASVPIFHQLFTRVSVDDSGETNASTFSLEMREMAFILRNVNDKSMVIVDELGRGTSTRDGLHIAIAISEALIESQAFVWFVTHFRELPRILKERAGVVNLHLAVDFQPEQDRITMLYRVADGYCEEEGYGIAMARVVKLPRDVIETAMEVSREIREKEKTRKKSSKAIAIARRRRLILNMHEQLGIAQESQLEGNELRVWLKGLQDEFVRRMMAIDEELREAEEAEEEEEVVVVDDRSSEETVDRQDSREAEMTDVGPESQSAYS